MKSKEHITVNHHGQWSLSKSAIAKDEPEQRSLATTGSGTGATVDADKAKAMSNSFNATTGNSHAIDTVKGWFGRSEAEDMVGDRIDNSMLISQLEALDHHIKEIREHLNGKEVAPDWVKSKVAVASDKLSDIAHYILGVQQGHK